MNNNHMFIQTINKFYLRCDKFMTLSSAYSFIYPRIYTSYTRL